MSRHKARGYQALDTLNPPARGWSARVEMRLQEFSFPVKLFKLVATNGDI